MLKPKRMIRKTSCEFFCKEACCKGTVVGIEPDTDYDIVAPLHLLKNRPFGIIMNDVVDLDLTRQHINFYGDEVPHGGKVVVFRSGELLILMKQGYKVKRDTDIYVNPKTGLLTTKVTDYKVGLSLSNQDSDGYVYIDFEF